MASRVARSSLTAAQQKLLTEMQRINYGRILDLEVRCGQPVMDPAPRIVRKIKFTGENGPRGEVVLDDFTLKAQVRELFVQFETLGDGVIPCIEIQRGLPFWMDVEEVPA